MSLTRVNGAEFWIQFIEEFLFDLEMKGFKIVREAEPILGSLELDVDLILRVFNNLSSNIIKYADSKESIRVRCRIEGENLHLDFENQIGEKESMDSTEIGLKTCEKILKMHNGTFAWSKGESFTVKISLPYKQK